MPLCMDEFLKLIFLELQTRRRGLFTSNGGLIMTTRKSSKKKASKSTRKAAKGNTVKEAQTTERTDLDRHPRPEQASGEAVTFASNRGDLDQHPRPTFQTAPVAPAATAEAMTATSLAATVSAPACTRSKIAT